MEHTMKRTKRPKFKQPARWKHLQRHPLNAEYGDLSGRAWDLFRAHLTQNGLSGRKITLHEGKVLDGWQLQRACVELDVTPDYQPLPKGWTPEAFVEAANDHRRHETQEQAVRRVDERRERVARARADGQSLRTIAEAEGISEAQVRNDLAASTAQGCAVEPANGKVMGRDGKARPARKPKRATAKVKRPAIEREPGDDTESEAAEAAPGTSGAQGCSPEPAREPTPEEEMKAANAKIESFCRALTKFVEENLPDDFWLRHCNTREGARRKFLDGCEMLRANKCVAVCPKCQKAKDPKGKTCPHCHGTGRLPRLNLETV
jgi:hypothetical protein